MSLSSIFIIFIVPSFFLISILKEKFALKELKKKEELYQNIEIHNTRVVEHDGPSVICSQSMVISVSLLNKYLASIIDTFGGNLPVLESLIDRTRREVIVKLIENNPDAKSFVNLKVDTCVLSDRCVESHAYATALF